MAEYKTIPIDLVDDPPLPVRASMDEVLLAELMDSIRQIGIVQNLVVVPYSAPADAIGVALSGRQSAGEAAESAENGKGSGVAALSEPRFAAAPLIRFRTVAGHRRLIAARAVGLTEVPCMVYPSVDIAEEAVKLAENLYREDLTAAEQGVFFAELIEKYDCSEEALCKMVKQKPDYIFERLQLLRGDPEVLQACATRKITFSMAKELNRCAIEATRRMFLHQAIENGVTARVMRQWVNKAHSITPHEEPQATEQQAEPQPAASAQTSQACAFCGGSSDPYNLVYGQMHFWEWNMVREVLEKCGIEIKGTWPGR